MQSYDLCFAWNWPYDSDFVELLAQACHAKELSLYLVNPTNLEPTLHSLNSNQLSFRAYFDRASDSDENFTVLARWARHMATVRINRFRLARRAWDKAAMHQLILYAGLKAPHTLVLPCYDEQPCIPPRDLQPLGGRFAIKPAHGGGGKGVVVAATNWEQVMLARQKYPNDRYLLQAHVDPALLDGRPAWFRVLYCAGQVFPCWWDPFTHRYLPLSEADQNRYNLHPLLYISNRLAYLSQLELFSTEIALTQEGEFFVVDYINDPVDLRLQYRSTEGVPDHIVMAIARHLANHITARCTACSYPQLLTS